MYNAFPNASIPIKEKQQPPPSLLGPSKLE
jgi:hypothetical protein